MIHISDIAKRIEHFLLSKNEQKFKIYIRINFRVDVYIFTDDTTKAASYKDEFQRILITTSKEDPFYDKLGSGAPLDKILNINFNVISLNEAEQDSFYEDILESSDSHIDFGPRYRFDSMLKRDMPKMKANEMKVPIVTFYSYKGGMGRTTSMMSYAMSLACSPIPENRKKVVIVDCDLEAPGYLNFFNLSTYLELRNGKKNGLVEFICDALTCKDPEMLDINDYLIRIGMDGRKSFKLDSSGEICIVPAGNLNEDLDDSYSRSGSNREDYLEGLAKINLSNVSSVVRYFNLLFKKLNDLLKPDIILLDSRTGFNDIFGTAALHLSTCVVGFFGFSRQTQPGLMNLIRQYYAGKSEFKLQLVFSIIPDLAADELVENQKKEVNSYISNIGNEYKDYPPMSLLHRNPILEKIGTSDKDAELKFTNMVINGEFPDYKTIFKRIDDSAFVKEEENIFNTNVPAIELRNTILRHLQDELKTVKNFAEEAEVRENQFFYRSCMKDLFLSEKFLIQGYKGTGKTYLYKALANPDIASRIQKWSGTNDGHSPIFVNILPTTDKPNVFTNMRFEGKTQDFFRAFWQIYSWNIVILMDEFAEIRKASELSEYALSVDGQRTPTEVLLRIEEIIEKGLTPLASIEKDFKKINAYLEKSRKRLFVLYDRLDTLVNPLNWRIGVSPLINYWEQNHSANDCISPKIFIRTDLMAQIHGTNTARLKSKTIRIEWSIGEVFGYFFKLIFTDKRASEAYWTIYQKTADYSRTYHDNTRRSFEKFPENQFKSLTREEMLPIVEIFFGKYVRFNDANLGSPWEYFERELSNADNTAICLRPFINTLNSAVIAEALDNQERRVQFIIPPSIYASRKVRIKAADEYFEDLAQDVFSSDLMKFKSVLQSDEGKSYRYKALQESQFDSLLKKVNDQILDSEVVKRPEDLKNLLFANGIMAEKITTKGKFYRFAPIYWYPWGLVNSELENDERQVRKSEERQIRKSLNDGKRCTGVIIDEYSRFNKRHIRSNEIPFAIELRDGNTQNFYQDDKVSFTLRKEADKRDPSKDFWYAEDAKLEED